MWNRVTDKDEITRLEAISGLAKRKDRKIKEVLKTELENIDENGSLILESIELFNDKDFIPLLEKKIIALFVNYTEKEHYLQNRNRYLNRMGDLYRPVYFAILRSKLKGANKRLRTQTDKIIIKLDKYYCTMNDYVRNGDFINDDNEPKRASP